MLKVGSIFIMIILSCFRLSGQWQTNGTAIYNSNIGNVGIGIAKPEYKLHSTSFNNTNITSAFIWGQYYGASIGIQNTNSNYYALNISNGVNENCIGGKSLLFVRGDGNIGIGTISPAEQLHLASDNNHSLLLSRADGSYGFRILRKAQEGNFYFQIGIGSNSWETKIKIGEGEGVNTKIILNPDGGNVLIGKTTQTGTRYKLDVEGPVRAHEIVVNTTGADFVFEPTYKLRSLSELETFIRTNKHLPDIAPAKEMQENGISAGEMHAKLLQKVEELTLYVIELKKENEQLEKEKDEQQIQQLKMLMDLKKEIEILKTSIK